MKKGMSGIHSAENTYAASHKNYRPTSDVENSENWFSKHKKLLWGIGGALALGTGALIYFKNKNSYDKYSDRYDDIDAANQNEMYDFNQELMNDLGEEDIVITTITEFE
ncbi:MAG TPA: hypothetical protein VFU62_09050 [Hanamia sp.]|jgi:hypothetical protein|nr:hypothetical protein [Hanamia sp.]